MEGGGEGEGARSAAHQLMIRHNSDITQVHQQIPDKEDTTLSLSQEVLLGGSQGDSVNCFSDHHRDLKREGNII